MNAHHTTFAAIVCMVAHGAASGQTAPADRPWYVGATQDFTHESNVLGTTTGEISDTISTTTLRAGLNQPFGRQRLRADATLSHQRYKELSERDNSGYTVGLLLDWSTIERLSGSLSLASQRRQADVNVGGITPAISNIERSDELGFRARLGVASMLAFEAGVGHRRVSFSAPEYAAREYKQDNGNLGIVYRPGGLLTLSTGVSGADTRYLAPEAGQTQPDRNKRRDVYLSANWVPTGASTVDARLAYGTSEYDLATSADFEGLTGTLRWTWRPSGRLTLTTALSRDSGQEAGYVRTAADDGTTSATDFSRVTNRVGLSAAYQLTGKVDLIAELSHARRGLVDRVTGDTGRDNTSMAALGARWAVTRTIALGCNLSRESRSASGVGSTDLDNDRFGCFGSVTVD
jgi:hypothetical protein